MGAGGNTDITVYHESLGSRFYPILGGDPRAPTKTLQFIATTETQDQMTIMGALSEWRLEFVLFSTPTLHFKCLSVGTR